jgi:hypothetical protein
MGVVPASSPSPTFGLQDVAYDLLRLLSGNLVAHRFRLADPLEQHIDPLLERAPSGQENDLNIEVKLQHRAQPVDAVHAQHRELAHASCYTGAVYR